MLNRRKLVARCAAALAAPGVLPRAAAEPGVSNAVVLLGQSVALSGPLGELGNEYRAGTQLWFDHVNSAGGIAGRQLKLLSLDDGYSTERAIANTRRLVEQDGVFAIFGQFGTGITRASFSSTIHQGVPMFAPFTGADSLRDYGNRCLFHVRASYGQELRHMIDHLLTIGIGNIGVVYQDDDFGQAALNGTLAALQRKRTQPVVTGAIAISPMVDVRRAVAAISEKRPPAIIMCTSGMGAVAFIKKYREKGAPTQFYCLSEVGSRELAIDLGPASRGIVIAQVVPSPWSALVPVSMEYQRLRQKQPPMPASYGSLEGFIAAKVFTEGLKRAGRNLSRESLVDQLETISDFDMGGFRVSYDAGNHTGSNFVDLSMLSTNGEFVR